MFRNPNIPILFCDGGACEAMLKVHDDFTHAMYLSSSALEKRARKEGWYLDNGLRGKSLCPACKESYEGALCCKEYPNFKLPETGNFFNGKGEEVKEYNKRSV